MGCPCFTYCGFHTFTLTLAVAVQPFLPVLLLSSGQRAVVGTEPWLEPVVEQAWAVAVKKGSSPAPLPTVDDRFCSPALPVHSLLLLLGADPPPSRAWQSRLINQSKRRAGGQTLTARPFQVTIPCLVG